VLLNQLDALERSDDAGRVEQRYRRLRKYGAFKAA
jgi:acetyl-CoA carboxylase alpha subunit